MLALLLFVLVFVLILRGFPVAFTLGGVSVLFGLVLLLVAPDAFRISDFQLLPLRFMGTVGSSVLMAVPLFVFMGIMLEKSGLAEDMLSTMGLLFGHLRGGLAISVILVGALLAASTGIVGATVVTMGLISLPTMLKAGYSPALAGATIATSGTLGQIIPPSIILVLLADTMSTNSRSNQVDVGALFSAALVPGLLLVGLYLLYIILLGVLRPQQVPKLSEEELRQFRGEGFAGRLLKAFLLPMLLIVAVLGSILVGLASPTEAAAVGATGAILLTIFQGKFSKTILQEVMQQTTRLSSMVFFILLGATTFTLLFRSLGGDRYLVELITEANLSPYVFLGLVMLVIFVAGFFIDFIEIIFIFIPVVTPVFDQFGMDMLWIGVLIALNLQTSFITPPFGFSLFYLKGVAPSELGTRELYKGVLPFIIIQLLFIGLCVAFPSLVHWMD